MLHLSSHMHNGKKLIELENLIWKGYSRTLFLHVPLPPPTEETIDSISVVNDKSRATLFADWWHSKHFIIIYLHVLWVQISARIEQSFIGITGHVYRFLLSTGSMKCLFTISLYVSICAIDSPVYLSLEEIYDKVNEELYNLKNHYKGDAKPERYGTSQWRHVWPITPLEEIFLVS